jgi:hypothetical protein
MVECSRGYEDHALVAAVHVAAAHAKSQVHEARKDFSDAITHHLNPHARIRQCTA